MSSEPAGPTLDLLEPVFLGRLSEAPRRPWILGLCGAQGSGKSTLAAALKRRLGARGVSVAVLSLDDLYLPHAKRARLATEVHPLALVRGPPGTHDVELGLRLVKALRAHEPVALPRFDKAADDPTDPAGWERVQGLVNVVVFEGWMVGARPQEDEQLLAPINALEREEDPYGLWRRWANRQLAADYQALFAQLDMLVLLAAPGFGEVSRWRRQQEDDLRASLTARGAPTAGTMSDSAVDRFVALYQRLTEHILRTMPAYADSVVRLDCERRIAALASGSADTPRAAMGVGRW